MLKIIFLPDIIGKIGRAAVKKQLPLLIKKYRPHLVIANAENLAHGIGFTEKTLAEMTAVGVGVFTSGNHAWKKADADKILNDPNTPIIRPANYPGKKSGAGWKAIKIGQNKIMVVNLLGRVYIKEEVNCPFKTLEKIIKKNPGAIFIVDFHGEATSEKNALAQYFDGRVATVIGTHTHVPTCDERVLEKGTGFVTDGGMIGYYDSVIGADKYQVFNLFLETGKSSKKHDLPEKGLCQFNAIYLEIDEKTKKTKMIKRLDRVIKI